MALPKISSVFLIYLFGLIYSQTAAQNMYCGCSPILCCSEGGYCGITDGHCGAGCKSGPCRRSKEPLDRIVTQEFFNKITRKASTVCPGKGFYTRESFLQAVNNTYEFRSLLNRFEIAALFAHFSYETRDFCFVEDVSKFDSAAYCDVNTKRYPCAQGKSYHERGPFRLSFNYNYGTCGQYLGLDLLRQPELVASNATVAFMTGLWFWMKSVRPVLNQGFGATIMAINGNMECSGGNTDAVNARIDYYRDYCKQFDINATDFNLSC